MRAFLGEPRLPTVFELALLASDGRPSDAFLRVVDAVTIESDGTVHTWRTVTTRAVLSYVAIPGILVAGR